jgi:hypothetical protein
MLRLVTITWDSFGMRLRLMKGMLKIGHLSVFAGFIALFACDTSQTKTAETLPQDAGPQTPMVEYIDCAHVFSGIPWPLSHPTEGDGPIDDELDAVDYSILPEQIDISGLSSFFRGHIAYALEITPEDLPTSLERDVALNAGPMGRVVLASLVREAGRMDFLFYRRGLQQYYTCSRKFPKTLEGFKTAVYDYSVSHYTDVPNSIAKCDLRRLYTEPTKGVFVAESIIAGEIRETEILLTKNRSDGQIDFLVYGANGEITDRSQFPTVSGEKHVLAGVPYVCSTCHMNREASSHTYGFNTLFPHNGPCSN